MSKLIRLAKDKGPVIDLITRALHVLAFDSIAPGQRTATMAHLTNLARDPRPWDVACTLKGDETGHTILQIAIKPRG